MRSTVALILSLAVAAPAVAQDPDPSIPVKGSGKLPAGWMMRLDNVDIQRGRSMSDVSFMEMGRGFHIKSGPRAIYWNPSMKAQGLYTATATFTETKTDPAAHNEAYGLVVGGTNLELPTQEYMYFITRGDGQYMIRHAAGAELHTIADWTASPALNARDASGKGTNTLTVRVAADSIHFMANGKPVTAFKRNFDLDGIVGLRVSHNLDVMVTGLSVTGLEIKK